MKAKSIKRILFFALLFLGLGISVFSFNASFSYTHTSHTPLTHKTSFSSTSQGSQKNIISSQEFGIRRHKKPKASSTASRSHPYLSKDNETHFRKRKSKETFEAISKKPASEEKDNSSILEFTEASSELLKDFCKAAKTSINPAFNEYMCNTTQGDFKTTPKKIMTLARQAPVSSSEINKENHKKEIDDSKKIEEHVQLENFSENLNIVLGKSSCDNTTNQNLHVGVFMTEDKINIAIKAYDDMVILYQTDKPQNIAGPTNTFLDLDTMEGGDPNCALKTIKFAFTGSSLLPQ